MQNKLIDEEHEQLNLGKNEVKLGFFSFNSTYQRVDQIFQHDRFRIVYDLRLVDSHILNWISPYLMRLVQYFLIWKMEIELQKHLD